MLLSRLTLGRCELALLALTATAARAQAPGPSGTAGSNVSNVSNVSGRDYPNKPIRMVCVPTVAASGLPGYESVSPFGVFAPAGTPAAIINLLNRDIVRALNQPDAKERVLSMGGEVVANSPAQFAAIIKVEMAKRGKLIKGAGIRDD